MDAATGEEWTVRRAASTVARLAVTSDITGIGEGAHIAVIGANLPWHYTAHVATP